MPLKRSAQINLDALPETTDPGFSFRYIDISAVGRGHLTAEPVEMRFADAPSRARRLVRKGDTIVSTVRTYLRAVLHIDEPADIVVSTGFAVITPGREMEPRFLAWVLESDGFIEEVVARSVGVSYPAISPDELGSIPVPVPAKTDQRAIADFLDAETARIDQLIEKNLQMTTLLETRLGLVAYALTVGGVGPRVALRRLVRQVKTGTTPSADKMEALIDGVVPWYSPGDVEGPLRLGNPVRSLQAEAVEGGWVPLFPADSTLVVGIGATAGRVAHLEHEATGNQQMTCIVSGSLLLPRFLSWQLFARSDELRATAPFTTMPILSNDFLRSLSTVFPQKDRQAQAVKRLDAEAARTRLLATRIRLMVGLLLERRVALITAAVTGRLVVPPGV